MYLATLLGTLLLTAGLGFTISTPSKLLAVDYPLMKDGDMPWPFSLCGSGHWTPTNLTITNAPTSRLEFGFDVEGTANSPISFSACLITLLYEGQPLANLYDAFQMDVDKGDPVSYARGIQTGGALPPGNFGLKLQFLDQNSAAEGCVQFFFKI